MKTADLKNKIISDYFASNKLSEGTKLPIVKKLASQYSVSTPTIGKAVALLEAEGWLTKKRGSGLYVAKSAFYCQSGNKKIGCIIPNFNLSMAYKIAMGVESVAGNYKHLLEIANSNGVYEDECNQIESMIKRGIEGIVLYPAPNRAHCDYEFLSEKYCDFPIVVTDIYSPSMKRPHVIFDNFNAGYEMTHYLLSKNYKEIAFLIFSHISYNSLDDRVKGYRKALRGATDIQERIISYPIHGNLDKVNLLTDKLLSLTPKLDAIIVPNDCYADPIIDSLKAKGHNVPQEIMVCGFDNTQNKTNKSHYPTTSPDFFRMGERAAEFLFDMIESKHTGYSEITLSCPLLIPEKSDNRHKELSFFNKNLNNNIFAWEEATKTAVAIS